MREITKDEVFEVLLIQTVEGETVSKAMARIFRRDPTSEERAYYSDLCTKMYRGWVRQNQNIRNLGRV